MLIPYFRKYRFFLLIILTALVLGVSLKITAHPLSVRVNRWLEVRNLSGSVDSLQNGQWKQAQSGQRLGNVGDGIRTGAGALARLAVDTGIGFVSVSENTDLRITDLYTTSRGGKVTKLDVSRGQARIFVRPFNNPDSRLEIRTPAGVNGVRGTDFGVLTQLTGRSALAVKSGGVVSSSEGASVPVDAGMQNMIVPGEPPSPAEPLKDDPSLRILRLERQARQLWQTMVVIQGNTSPYNLLVIDGETQITDREGNFNLRLRLPASQQFQAKVITTLGTEKVYELVVP